MGFERGVMMSRMKRMKTMKEEHVVSALFCRKTSQRRKVGCRGGTRRITSRTNASAPRPASPPSRRRRKSAAYWRWLPPVTSRQHPQHQMMQISVRQSRLCVCCYRGCGLGIDGVHALVSHSTLNGSDIKLCHVLS